jgi:hypothetical protein
MDCKLDMFSLLPSRDYFPMQNRLKMESSRSSVVVLTAPLIQELSQIKRSSVEKRRRAAALQDAGAIFLRPATRAKRFGLRQPSGALQ